MRAATAFTRMGEKSLANFNWATVGGHYDLPKAIVGPAQTGFLNFTTSYRNVMDSMSAKPNWLCKAHAIAQLPAQEYYTSSQILSLVSDDDASIEEVSKETKQ